VRLKFTPGEMCQGREVVAVLHGPLASQSFYGSKWTDAKIRFADQCDRVIGRAAPEPFMS
jgi:hypothetical protein